MKMNFEKQTILLTGATGFTGLHLGKRLKHLGANVIGMTNSSDHQMSSDLIYAPLEDQHLVKEAVAAVKPNYVIHLAGVSYAAHDNALPYYNINVLGTENLLKACVEQKETIEKIILASSAAVYGDPKLDLVPESRFPAPISHYGASKLAMEHIADLYVDKLPIQITRPFNYTGPGQPKQFLIPKIISHFIDRKSSIELGNTNIIREFSDVRDAVENYIALLKTPETQTVNLCSGQANSFADVLETLKSITGHDIIIQTNPDFIRPNDIMKLVGDATRLRNLTNRRPAHSLRDTLNAMLIGLQS